MKINIMLVTFIMITFVGFKFLYLQSEIPSEDVDECEFDTDKIPLLVNCFKKVRFNCQDEDGDYHIVFEGDVCINFAETESIDGNCVVGEALEVNDLVECVVYIGNVVVLTFRIIASFILSIWALMFNVYIFVGLYIALMFATVDGAPFIIDFIVVAPLVIMNVLVIVSVIPGEE
jgi:hypothetical protein